MTHPTDHLSRFRLGFLFFLSLPSTFPRPLHNLTKYTPSVADSLLLARRTLSSTDSCLANTQKRSLGSLRQTNNFHSRIHHLFHALFHRLLHHLPHRLLYQLLYRLLFRLLHHLLHRQFSRRLYLRLYSRLYSRLYRSLFRRLYRILQRRPRLPSQCRFHLSDWSAVSLLAH